MRSFICAGQTNTKILSNEGIRGRAQTEFSKKWYEHKVFSYKIYKRWCVGREREKVPSSSQKYSLKGDGNVQAQTWIRIISGVVLPSGYIRRNWESLAGGRFSETRWKYTHRAEIHTEQSCTQSRDTHRAELHTEQSYTQSRDTHRAELHTEQRYTQSRAAHRAELHTEQSYTQSRTTHRAELHTEQSCTQSRATHRAELHTEQSYTQSRDTHRAELHTEQRYTQSRAAHRAELHTEQSYTQSRTTHRAELHTEQSCTQSRATHRAELHTEQSCTQSRATHRAELHTEQSCTQSRAAHRAVCLRLRLRRTTDVTALTSMCERLGFKGWQTWLLPLHQELESRSINYTWEINENVNKNVIYKSKKNPGSACWFRSALKSNGFFPDPYHVIPPRFRRVVFCVILQSNKHTQMERGEENQKNTRNFTCEVIEKCVGTPPGD